jgi:hypothetical protein
MSPWNTSGNGRSTGPHINNSERGDEHEDSGDQEGGQDGTSPQRLRMGDRPAPRAAEVTPPSTPEIRGKDDTVKIQVIKKADKKPNDHSGCAWVIDQLPEPRK